MNSDAKEVLRTLSELAVKIKASNVILSDKGIGNALLGLKCMSSDAKEVLHILSELAVSSKQVMQFCLIKAFETRLIAFNL